MFLGHNERTKLTANWLSGMGTALIGAGVFAPAIAFFYGLSTPGNSGLPLSVITGGCFLVAVVLHGLGRLTLRRLQE